MRTGLALTLVAAVTAVGCGKGSERQGPAAPPIDACELLTQEDASAVLGPGAGKMTSFAEDELGKDPSYCSYSTGATVPPDTVSLQVRRYPSPERAARALEAVRSTLDAEPLPGLGDGAYWAGRVGQLHLRRGDVHITVTVQAAQVRDPYIAAKRVAEQALQRL